MPRAEATTLFAAPTRVIDVSVHVYTNRQHLGLIVAPQVEMVKIKAPGQGSSVRRRRAKNLLWAAAFFVLGVIGVMVPIMPQVPFFIVSLLFLSLVFPSVRRAVRRFLHRHPKLAHAYKNWKDHRRKKRLDRIRRVRDSQRA